MNDPLDVDAAKSREAQRKDAQRADALKADNDFRWIMADARGRRVIWQLLIEAGIYRSSFAADPAVTAFNEGKRDAGLRLLAKLTSITPDEYLQMQKENTSANS